jgi:hypothetical protein
MDFLGETNLVPGGFEEPSLTMRFIRTLQQTTRWKYGRKVMMFLSSVVGRFCRTGGSRS